MSSVSEFDVECPICGGKFAHSDLDCRTHERLLSCERCGFYYETRVVERNDMGFWEMTEVRPISRDATKVAVFDGDEGPKWNGFEFRTLPSFTAIPVVFGAKEAEQQEDETAGKKLNCNYEHPGPRNGSGKIDKFEAPQRINTAPADWS